MTLGAEFRILDAPADAPSRQYLQSRNESWMGLFTSAAPCVCWRSLYVGGYSNTNSSNALNWGLSYVNGNNSLSNSNTNIGGRLSSVLITSSITVTKAPSEDEIQENQPCRASTDYGTVRQENKGIGMNRIGDLFWDVALSSNVEQSAKMCCQSRRDKMEVARFLADRDAKLKEVQKMILELTYVTSQYHFFERNEHGKVRKIADLPLFPDRIIRQCFAQVVGPALDKKLIEQTHASRPGHGIHSALVQAREYIDSSPKVVYCLSLDIHKCYESLDPVLLKQKLARNIKDRKVLKFLYQFIDDYPGDGISIGDCMSPIFCNLYLSALDHYIKEVMKCHLYIRYADNLYIFGYSKQWLLQVQQKLDVKVREIHLEFNANWTIADLTKEGVDFLGFRLFKTHTLLRKKTKIRMKRAIARIDRKLESGQYPDEHDRGTIASYKGMLMWCDSYNLYRKTIWPVEMKIAYLERELIGAGSFRRFIAMSEVYQ